MRQSASIPPRFHSGALVPPPSAPFPLYSTTFMTSLYFYINFNIYFNLMCTTDTKLTSLRSSLALSSPLDTVFYRRGWVFLVCTD